MCHLALAEAPSISEVLCSIIAQIMPECLILLAELSERNHITYATTVIDLIPHQNISQIASLSDRIDFGTVARCSHLRGLGNSATQCSCLEFHYRTFSWNFVFFFGYYLWTWYNGHIVNFLIRSHIHTRMRRENELFFKAPPTTNTPKQCVKIHWTSVIWKQNL